MYLILLVGYFLQNIFLPNVTTTSVVTTSQAILHEDSQQVFAASAVDTQEFRYLGQINCVPKDQARFLFVFADADKNLYNLYKPAIQDLAIDLDASLNYSARINGNGIRHFNFQCDETNRPEVIWEQSTTDINELSDKYQDMNIKTIFYAKDFGVCGRAWLVPTPVKKDNPNNTGGGAAFISLYCFGLRVTMHEIGHSLGAVQLNAPNASQDFHCTDAYDVLCYLTVQAVCPDLRYDSVMYDCNGDDYFRVNKIEKYSYLDLNWNIADSRYLSHYDRTYFPIIYSTKNAECTYCILSEGVIDLINEK